MFLVKTKHKDEDVQRFLAKTDTGKRETSGDPNIWDQIISGTGKKASSGDPHI